MFLLELPALAKIFLTFTFILLLSRKCPLYVCLFAGAAIIGLWMGQPVFTILKAIWIEATSAQTLWLSGVIILILMLSRLLKAGGQLDRIVESFQKVSPGPRFTLAAMPALIGLLPMPGGALFSAPMVDSAVGTNNVKPELKLAINYWYRHVWEYWWPLYPGIILAISLFGIDAWKLTAAQSPLTIGAVVGGMVFILPSVGQLPSGRRPVLRSAISRFISEAMPVIVVILVFAGFQVFLQIVSHVAGTPTLNLKYLGLALGLIWAIGIVIRRNSLGATQVKEAVVDIGTLSMVLIIFGIMAFKGLLVESRAIEHVRWELGAYHIPPLLIIAALPLIAGFVTGIAIGFVGASFPLVVALVPAGESPIPYAVLAYGFGYMGMMMSPVHLCLLVSREYYCADLMKGYGYLWKPIVFGLFWTALLFLVYKTVL